MSSLYVNYLVEIDGAGKVVIGLSRVKAIKIINELNRLLPLSTYVFVRNGVPYIYLGIGKGGMMSVECSRGKVLYDVSNDSLMICLGNYKIESRRYLDVGIVAEGLEILESLESRRKAVIKKI